MIDSNKYLKLTSNILIIGYSDDNGISEDNLNESGLLGKWGITDETIKGISDLLPKCYGFSPGSFSFINLVPSQHN